MTVENKLVADSVLRLTDTIIKLSTALLVVPIAFLKFVSEMGLKAHPDALHGVHAISDYSKLGIFVPLSLSIVAGLITHYAVLTALCRDTLVVNGKLTQHITWLTLVAGLMFVVGTCFLTYLFFQFPIEFPEPFRIGITPIG